jgi:hypothetical protein
MKSKETFKNKLLISSIRLLLPNFDKTYYLNVIVNEDKSFNTKKMDFKKGNQVEMNVVFELENIDSIDSIRFQIFEKNSIFSNSIFKGEVNRTNKLKDESTGSLICFLSNNNGENSAVVYYNYEINSDLLDSFNRNLKSLENQQKPKVNQKSTLTNLMDLASGENAENFSRFVHNMEYMRSIQNSFEELINWLNPWKTIAFLLLITYGFSYWKQVVIFTPFFLIYFHLINRDTMDKFSHKKTRHDNLANMALVSKTIEVTNLVIEYYESFLEALQYSDSKIYELIYINLIKLTFFNCFIIFFPLIRFKTVFLVSIWIFFLWKNPSFRAFLIFLYNFTHLRFLSKISTYNTICDKIVNIATLIIPFADLVRKVYELRKTNSDCKPLISSPNNIKDVFDNLKEKTVKLSDFSSEEEVLKFEIYENERWWVVVGWSKNLILNERPLWSDIAGKTFMDKNSVFLPNNEEYTWGGDWRVEANENSDSEGWEYSSDFNSNFVNNLKGKYVRRRKWVRYAKKIKK